MSSRLGGFASRRHLPQAGGLLDRLAQILHPLSDNGEDEKDPDDDDHAKGEERDREDAERVVGSQPNNGRYA